MKGILFFPINELQFATFMKDVIFLTFKSFWKSYCYQRGTSIKCTFHNSCDTLRNDDGIQRITRRKRTPSYRCDGIRNSDRFQRRTRRKCTFSNRHDAIRDAYWSQRRARMKAKASDCCNSLTHHNILHFLFFEDQGVVGTSFLDS